MIRPTIHSLAVLSALALPLSAGAQAAAPAQPAPEGTAVTAQGPASAPELTRATYRPLSAGDHVRVIAGAGRYAGTLTAVSADTFMLAAPGRTDAVMRSDVSEIQRMVSREGRGRSIIRGAGLGVAVGAALGFLAGTAAGGKDCPSTSDACDPGHDRTAQAAFTIDGGLLGGLIGAMVGPTFRRTRWERVDTAAYVAVPPPAPAESAAPAQR